MDSIDENQSLTNGHHVTNRDSHVTDHVSTNKDSHVINHMTNEDSHVINHMTNGDSHVTDHMTNGDSHVTDHMTNGSIPDEEEDTLSADMSQDSCCPSGPLKTQASSTAAEDQIESAERASQESTSPTKSKQSIQRRQTYSQGMAKVSRSSSLCVTGSPGLKRYPSISGGAHSPRSMSISGGSSLVNLRTQLKRKSTSYNLSVKRQSRKTSTTVLSPTHKPSLKLVKVVLAGNDIMVSHTAKAYAHLRTDEPNLFSGLDIRFYHVPLSKASTVYGIDMGGASVSSTPRVNPELPEPMMEHLNTSGNDVHIGRFLAHMDSWYECNLMIAVHHLLRLLPAVSWACACSQWVWSVGVVSGCSQWVWPLIRTLIFYNSRNYTDLFCFTL